MLSETGTEPLRHLELKAASKRYGGKIVLHGVDHAFVTGLTLLVGPSGAGKSTLLRLIATAERLSGGVMLWNGVALPKSRRALRKVLGYAPQSVELPEELTGREFGLQMAALKGLERGGSNMQLSFLAERLGLAADFDRRITTYSGGMRRRLILVQAMLGEPRLLALDEPTAELDATSIGYVVDLVRERAKSAIVVMTTHLAEGLTETSRAILHVEGGQVRSA